MNIPFKGTAAVAQEVVSGRVPMGFLDLSVARGHLAGGKMRALAVASNRRLKDFPNLPTTVEKGFPELNLKIWVGFFAPAKTPPAAIKRLAVALGDSLKDAEIVANIEKAQALVENLGPAESAKFLSEEERKWSEVARVANISH